MGSGDGMAAVHARVAIVPPKRLPDGCAQRRCVARWRVQCRVAGDRASAGKVRSHDRKSCRERLENDERGAFGTVALIDGRYDQDVGRAKKIVLGRATQFADETCPYCESFAKWPCAGDDQLGLLWRSRTEDLQALNGHEAAEGADDRSVRR